jgi:hypothetical protein
MSGASSPQLGHALLDSALKSSKKIQPYICFGFKIQDAIVYMSDVSHIPEDTWSLLEHQSRSGLLPVFVCDCLRLHAHASHMGLGEAIATSRRLGASRTYLVGFGHDVSHDEYVVIGEVAGGHHKRELDSMSVMERRGTDLIEDGKPLWIRPAHDGLRVFVSKEDAVRDESYS